MHLHANIHNVSPHTHTQPVCVCKRRGRCIVHCKYAYSMHALVLAARAVNRRAGRGKEESEKVESQGSASGEGEVRV